MRNNRNRFLKWFLGLFSILYFVFSLRVAEAKGVATIFTVIAVVVLAVIIMNPAVFAVQGPGMSLAATFVAHPIITTIAAISAASLVGMAIGQIQCLGGQNNIWFSGCSSQGGSPSGWSGSSGSPTVTYENIQSGCDYCNLTFDFKNAYAYTIYKAEEGQSKGILLTSHKYGTSTSTRLTYSDTGLTPHKRYRYVLVLYNSSGKKYQYPPLDGYTKCLSKCSFSIDKNTIVLPGEATLSWNCSDANVCQIESSQKGKLAKNLAIKGSLKVQPQKAEQTIYTLSCNNIDGMATFSTSLDVKKVGYKEVKP